MEVLANGPLNSEVKPRVGSQRNTVWQPNCHKVIYTGRKRRLKFGSATTSVTDNLTKRSTFAITLFVVFLFFIILNVVSMALYKLTGNADVETFLL